MNLCTQSVSLLRITENFKEVVLTVIFGCKRYCQLLLLHKQHYVS